MNRRKKDTAHRIVERTRPIVHSLRLRMITVCAVVVAVLASGFVGATPASAGTGCHSQLDVYGSSAMKTCHTSHRDGSHVYYVRVFIKSTQNDPITGLPLMMPPNFVGCGVHAQLVNLNNPQAFNVDTARIGCNDFVAQGGAFIVGVYRDVPPGRYCSRLWWDVNDVVFIYSGGSCFTIQ